METERVKRLAGFVSWVGANIKGDEKGEAQVFLDRIFQARPLSLGVWARRTAQGSSVGAYRPEITSGLIDPVRQGRIDTQGIADYRVP